MRRRFSNYTDAVEGARAAAKADGRPHAVMVGDSWFAITRADHIPPGQADLVTEVIEP